MSVSKVRREDSLASPETTSRTNAQSGSYNESSYNANLAQPNRLSASTRTVASSLTSSISPNDPSIQQWRLPLDWNWQGGPDRPADVVTIDPSTSPHPLADYPYPRDPSTTSKQSSIVGFSHATVSRVICQRKVLARKSEALPRSRTSSYHLEEMRILKLLDHQHIIQLCGSWVASTTACCTPSRSWTWSSTCTWVAKTTRSTGCALWSGAGAV
jgi:hypothetical protein